MSLTDTLDTQTVRFQQGAPPLAASQVSFRRGCSDLGQDPHTLMLKLS